MNGVRTVHGNTTTAGALIIVFGPLLILEPNAYSHLISSGYPLRLCILSRSFWSVLFAKGNPFHIHNTRRTLLHQYYISLLLGNLVLILQRTAPSCGTRRRLASYICSFTTRAGHVSRGTHENYARNHETEIHLISL